MNIHNVSRCFAAIFTASMLTGCGPMPVAPGAKETSVDATNGQKGAVEKIVTIEHVVRIFMHQPKEFTYWYMTPGTSNQVSSFTVTSESMPTIILDAEETNVWVKYWGESEDTTCKFVEMHLNSIDEAGGAGWVRKSGKSTYMGITTVVQ